MGLIPRDRIIWCEDCKGVFDSREARVCPGCGGEASLICLARWMNREEQALPQFDWEMRRGPTS